MVVENWDDEFGEEPLIAPQSILGKQQQFTQQRSSLVRLSQKVKELESLQEEGALLGKKNLQKNVWSKAQRVIDAATRLDSPSKISTEKDLKKWEEKAAWCVRKLEPLMRAEYTISRGFQISSQPNKLGI